MGPQISWDQAFLVGMDPLRCQERLGPYFALETDPLISVTKDRFRHKESPGSAVAGATHLTAEGGRE